MGKQLSDRDHRYIKGPIWCTMVSKSPSKSAEVHVYNVFLNGEEVAMVTKRCPVSSKKKGDKTEYKWEEVSPIEQEIE